jgi:hypothetical protein
LDDVGVYAAGKKCRSHSLNRERVHVMNLERLHNLAEEFKNEAQRMTVAE